MHSRDVLAEEDGHGKVAKDVDKLVVAGTLEARVTTPRVRVDAKEVRSRHVILVAIDVALQIVCLIVTELLDVSSGIADGDLATSPRLHVVLHVALNGADVGRVSLGGGDVVYQFVGTKKAKSIWIAAEGVNDVEGAVQVLGIISLAGLGAVDGGSVKRGINIYDHVDADGIEN